MLLWPAPSQAREEPPPPPRVVGISHGVGATHGILGVSVETYLLDTRLSVLVSLGPRLGGLDGDAVTALSPSAGVRVFTGGSRNRAYGQLAVSVVERSWDYWEPGPPDTDYLAVPTLTGGYHLVTGSGFTMMVGAGVSYSDEEGPMPTAELGFGYTLRARWMDMSARGPLEDPPRPARRRWLPGR